MVSALRAIVAKVFPPVPALLGHFNNAIVAFAKIVPIGIDIDSLRIPAAQSNNGNRVWARWALTCSTTALAAEPPARIQPALKMRLCFRPGLGFHLDIIVRREQRS